MDLMTTANSDAPQENYVELKMRVGLLLTAYGAALLILIKDIEGFVLFPLGLFYILSKLGLVKFFDSLEIVSQIAFLVIGWMLYLVITLSILLTKHKGAFLVLYFILIFMLIANVSGCIEMNSAY
jgi:hypothetical protein